MRVVEGSQRTLQAMFLSVLVTAFALFIGGCSSSLQLASKWNDRNMQIDGNLKDWTDSTVFVEKDDIRCGVMNDGENLYLCLISSKPNLGRQITFRGMTVWFDPNGGEKKTLGVRFPIGMGRGEMPSRAEGEETDQRGNRFAAMETQALSEFEYLGPGENDRQRVSRLEAQGVEMHLTSTPERFVYELKIPLSSSSAHPYAVESHPGAPIGICVETNTPTRSATPTEGEGEGQGEGPRGGRGGGGMRGGRMPGGGGGYGGGGYGRGRTNNSQVSFSFWSHVQLADKPH